MLLPVFDSTSLLMGPSLCDRYDDQGFGNPTDVDWTTFQGPNRPSDLWFDNIFSSLPHDSLQNTNLALGATQPAVVPVISQAGSQGLPVPTSTQGVPETGMISFSPTLLPVSAIQDSPTANLSESLFLSDPSLNSYSQGLHLPDAHPPSLLPPPISDVNPPPSLPGTIVPHVAPPLASVPTQECPLQVPSKAIQLPASLLGLPNGKENEAVADQTRGGGKSQGNSGNKRGGTRKRRANDALIGTKDGGTSKLRKKQHAKSTGDSETTGEEVTEATKEEKEADRLAKEAKAAQEAAIEAAKAAKVAAKAAKEAKEAAKPEQATRSGRASTLPSHLKEVGYEPPKRSLRAKKST